MDELKQRQLLLRNLEDAGCDCATIEQFFKLQNEGRKAEQLRLLFRHRASLLDRVHVGQHMIDCLDYLIYSMENEEI